ncbi:MAG: SGNH/GDSL hydrolase family protein [Lachnospiraceae bacterium]|nr:SGNH/GDSL hydrolase family protein [Lachnospiraceae bacterium]
MEASRAAAEAESGEQAAAEAAERLTGISDLSVYEKLAAGYDVNILIVGDSIGAASGASDAAHRWTVLFESYLEETYGSNVTLTNISMGGNASFAGYVRTMILDDGVDYDLAVICYGHNDSTVDFSLYYETIITAIHSKYENCSIISILESAQKGYTDKMETIEEICVHYSIPVADTIAPFLEYYNFYTDDGVHPNDDGQVIYAETVEKVVDKQVAANTGLSDYDITPVNADVAMFSNCEYTGADEFTRVDETTYTISISAAGIFGIDYSYQSGENSAEIYVDGELIAAPTVTFDYDFSQRHILIVSEECTVEDEITVVFDSEAQADGFYGICFCFD